jgi:hypothetical protein
MEMLRILERNRQKARFNWGFEAVFTQEIHALEGLGLIEVKYGSGAIMAGRSSPNAIYNVALTTDGRDTARVILDREVRARVETAKLGEPEEDLSEEDTDVDEPDETDRDESSTRIDKAPPSLPGEKYSHSE